MLRKMLIIATGLVVVLAAPAAAQYTPSATVSASVTQTPAGTPFSLTGEGFEPDVKVDITFLPDSSTKAAPAGTAITTATTDGSGSFSASVAFPAGTPSGSYFIRATSPSQVAQTAVEVVTKVASPGGTGSGSGTSSGVSDGTLPRTGSNSTIPLTLAGAGLLAVGGLIVLTVRRRPAVA